MSIPEAAVKLQREVTDRIARRMFQAREARGHTMQDAADSMGRTAKNLVFRLEHPRKLMPGGEPYGDVTKLDAITAAMSYCGMGWRDFDARPPASWPEVESVIRSLPELTEDQAAAVCEIARMAYYHASGLRHGVARDDAA